MEVLEALADDAGGDVAASLADAVERAVSA